jgi:DNA-binding IclR family transcriptional regulator
MGRAIDDARQSEAAKMSEITSKDSPLERYISILETVAPFTEGLTAVELETALDLPKTTVNRLLHALMSSGMVSADNARNRSYRLGDRILRLLHTSPDTSWLATLAQQPLQALADKTGQSAFISKFDGTEVRSVTCVAPDTPVRTYVMPGMSMPVNAAATAKAILAFQPEDVLARVLPSRLERYTEKTKTDIDVLMSEFAAIRERGYATDLAEHVAGLGSIALPVHVSGAEVAHAVGLTGPYDWIIERNFESHRQAIAETANRLSKLLQLRTPTTSG